MDGLPLASMWMGLSDKLGENRLALRKTNKTNNKQTNRRRFKTIGLDGLKVLFAKE